MPKVACWKGVLPRVKEVMGESARSMSRAAAGRSYPWGAFENLEIGSSG